MASIIESIEILSKEKGIDPQIVISAVTDAMLVAARKKFGPNEELAAELNPKTDQIEIFAVRRVVRRTAKRAGERWWSARPAEVRRRRSPAGGWSAGRRRTA